MPIESKFIGILFVMMVLPGMFLILPIIVVCIGFDAVLILLYCGCMFWMWFVVVTMCG